MGAILLAGCGYRPAAMPQLAAGQGPLSLAVPLWENRTGELGLAPMLREALIHRLQQSAGVRLAAGSQANDTATATSPLRLTGQILAMQRQPVAYDTHDQARQVRYRLAVKAALLTAAGQPLWRLGRLEIDEIYPVAGDALQTRSTRRQALARLCADLADEIALRLLEIASEAQRQTAPAQR